MKTTLLLLLFSIMAYAQPQVNTPPDLLICDEDNDGIATFDLNTVSTVILGGLNPSLYTISYHETLADANAGTNAIAFPQSYSNVLALTTNGSQTLYVRVQENAVPTNYSIAPFHIIVNMAPVINTPTAYIICNEALPNDGFATFDLTAKTAEILGANAGLGFTVQYFASAATLEAGLALPAIYTNTTPGTQTLYVKVTSIDGCTTNTTLTLKVNPLPDFTAPLPAIVSCGNTFNLSANAALHSPYWAEYYPTEQDAISGTNIISGFTSYTTDATSVWIKLTIVDFDPIVTQCYTLAEQPLTQNDRLMPIVFSDGNTLTVDVTGAGPFQYSIDNGPAQSENIFTNVPYGTHTIRVTDVCGNIYMISITVLPAPPTGAATQAYVEGSTLADLDVQGENIQWYAEAAATTALAATTVVTDGTTYYATQTIETYQSPTFGVLVSRAAGTDNNVFSGFTYYPNPVQNILTLQNNSEITKVEAYNLLGQLALQQNTSGTKATVNIQALQPGIYLVKAYSGSNAKVIRIIKAE